MDADTPHLGEDQKAVVQRRSVPELLEGERVEAGAPLETRKARLVSPLDAAEKRLIRLIQSRQDILQDVRVNRRVLWELRTDVFAFRPLHIAGDSNMTPLPGGDALFQGDIIRATL
jgi:hypothetical protein